MATHTADTVIDLESHPLWRSAQQFSEEIAEAMRRHPSYQGGAGRRACTVTPLPSRR